jgi:hypothetical protein
MKRIPIIALFLLILPAAFCQQNNENRNVQPNLNMNSTIIPDKNDRNNNFYDNEVTYSLPKATLEIAGEIENPGLVDFSKLQKRSVIVKETLLKDDGSDAFVGAYRYDGYSLFDILNDRIPKKKNEAEFDPIIDLYVEIENAKGEKVVMSWGEIYYPNFLHNAIIATDVMRIVPSKTKDLWPLPAESKLVIANDLVTQRNLSSPTKITVKSYPRSFKIDRELNPLTSAQIIFHYDGKVTDQMASLPKGIQQETLHTIFYGKGRGIHSTEPFTGVYLKEILKKQTPVDREHLKNGLVAIVGIDGYRSVYTFSEIMNRNDQAEVLVVPCADVNDGGKFRIFPSCDFFSDRAVKAVSEIYVEIAK